MFGKWDLYFVVNVWPLLNKKDAGELSRAHSPLVLVPTTYVLEKK